MLAQANALIAKATAIQNGDETVLDDEEKADDAATADAGEEVDINNPVEGENEEAPADDANSDPDLGEDLDNNDEAEAAEETAPEEEPKAEEEEPKEEDEKSEESEDEEDSEDDSDDDDSEDEDEEESELSDDADEDSDVDDSNSDPDLGEDLEDGADKDQQEAEEELTGDSLDDEDLEDDEDGEEDVEDTSVDGENSEPQGKIFDELEKEEDVQKAVQLIRQRVADAEEDFIKRNAEDKKKIDDLLGKISDNIKTVEDISDNDSTKSKIAQEATMMYRRKIKNITENRPQSVFERMARKLTESITKDSDLRSIYLAESGRADMASIIENTKVMYGFLEALSTLQLEKVDDQYIANVLKEM